MGSQRLVTFNVLDVETFGVGPKAFIYQAGLVQVKWDVDEKASVGMRLHSWDGLDQVTEFSASQAEMLESGAFDLPTMRWHLGPGKRVKDMPGFAIEAYRDIFGVADHLWDAAKDNANIFVAQNIEFDFLKLAYNTDSYASPIMLYNPRTTLDIRTLQTIGLVGKDNPYMAGKTHIAIEDALAEWKALEYLLTTGLVNVSSVCPVPEGK